MITDENKAHVTSVQISSADKTVNIKSEAFFDFSPNVNQETPMFTVSAKCQEDPKFHAEFIWIHGGSNTDKIHKFCLEVEKQLDTTDADHAVQKMVSCISLLVI